MNMLTFHRDQGPLPIKRWFCYLLLGVIITLALPYLSSHGDRYYSPSVATFHKVGEELVPTPDQIWIDGRSGALMSSYVWLYFAMGVILLEYMTHLFIRLWSSLRAPKVPVQVPSEGVS
jgi:hypothetical protein